MITNVACAITLAASALWVGTVNLLRPERHLGTRRPEALNQPWPHPIL